jgi:alanine or glycine:cation symporter, AGCS family
MTMQHILLAIDNILWERFLIFIIIGTGIFLTLYFKGMQFRYLPMSLKLAFSKHDSKDHKGDISQFQSLMTSLAATIGIASIAGMATAVMAGGFGSIFWMWVVALIGMVTKYSEAVLAVKFRSTNAKGRMQGGPMYYIEKGLNMKWLAVIFSFFGVLASFGGGNIIQSQSIADAVFHLTNIPHVVTGAIIMVIVAIVILGGIKKLGKVNAILVPTMALLYIVFGLIIIILNYHKVPAALGMIFHAAFSSKAVVGGMVG